MTRHIFEASALYAPIFYREIAPGRYQRLAHRELRSAQTDGGDHALRLTNCLIEGFAAGAEPGPELHAQIARSSVDVDAARRTAACVDFRYPIEEWDLMVANQINIIEVSP